jgi:hypothetical protein
MGVFWVIAWIGAWLARLAFHFIVAGSLVLDELRMELLETNKHWRSLMKTPLRKLHLITFLVPKAFLFSEE